MNGYINVLSALVGTLIGAGLTWYVNIRIHRTTRTMDLHKEFNVAEMIDARYRAGRILEDNPTADLNALRAEFGGAGLNDIFKVILFYQRLWLSIKTSRVNSKDVPELFGEIFDWWYLQSFSHQLLPLNNTLAKDIKAFHDWLVLVTPPHKVEDWRSSHIFWATD